MAFDSLEWIQLAEQLGRQSEESAQRTAIGRYYYGVFIQCRHSLEADGLLKSRGDEADHRAVVEALATHRRAAAAEALRGLRRLRNTADYDTGANLTLGEVDRAAHLSREVQRLCEADWRRTRLR